MIPSEVYFIQPFGGGPIKIGHSVNPQRRLRELQLSSPFALDLICTVPGGVEAEAVFHEAFASGRLHGEWFDESHEGLEWGIEQLLNPDLSIPEVAEFHQEIRRIRAKYNAEPTALLMPERAAGSDNPGG